MLRSALFYLGALIGVVVTYLTMLVCAPFGLRVRHRLLRAIAGFLLGWLRLTCGIRSEVRGLENMPAGPCVLLCKHQSAWETLALTRILPNATFVLKKELLEAPLLGFGFRAMHPIPIDRKRARDALREVVAQGVDRLRQGQAVVIFPEGTRVAPGAHAPWRKSGAELARKAEVPLVPVAHNSGSFWQHGAFAKRAGTIQLEFGPAAAVGAAGSAELTENARTWVEQRVQQFEEAASGQRPST